MKKDLMILLFLAVLLIYGCSGGSSTSTTGDMTGTDGITLSFVNNNPPTINYYGEDGENKIPVEVEAFNRGVYAPVTIETYFAGWDDKLVSISKDIGNIEFSDEESNKKTRYNPEGGYQTENAELNINDIGADTYDFTMKLIYCYGYTTQASIQVCVDPNPNKDTREDACTPGKTTTKGQGAPISIESVEVESMIKKARLRITIKDYSGGEIINDGVECKAIPERSDLDMITFTKPVLGDIEGKCSVEDDKLRMRNGIGTLICTFDLGDDKLYAYNTILKMEMSYRIKSSTEKNIKIINEKTN